MVFLIKNQFYKAGFFYVFFPEKQNHPKRMAKEYGLNFARYTIR
jgi:hypothetical protein